MNSNFERLDIPTSCVANLGSNLWISLLKHNCFDYLGLLLQDAGTSYWY